MSASEESNIDVRDLGSVRRAAKHTGRVVLGEDWVTPVEGDSSKEMARRRRKRGLLTLRRSMIARKIMMFNLVALIIMVIGVLYLNPSRDNLATQRAVSLTVETELIGSVLEARLDGQPPLTSLAKIEAEGVLSVDNLKLNGSEVVYVFDSSARLVSMVSGPPLPIVEPKRVPVITGLLDWLWKTTSNVVPNKAAPRLGEDSSITKALVSQAEGGTTPVQITTDEQGRTVFMLGTPIQQNGRVTGVVALTSGDGEIDSLVRQERELLLQVFVVVLLVSIGLSLVLASTIAHPLSDLAAAAELGQQKDARKFTPDRIRIPDLTGRPDEIGRLSSALRGMVGALYERIEANEQFAADVAHEIKNPLASLRSAVGTMRVAKRPDQREKLLAVIEHDVKRLDRLVSDISNASRLDSELVKEEEEPFDILKMLNNLGTYLGKQCKDKGVEYIQDIPEGEVTITGLESRLAQVFVNIITNAISFCEDGDAIRVWARQRENRILVVVEDTGPGIPDGALTKIFSRFYSERPENQFGDNSGLGLAISKQIVEAHGGVIWAENIRPTDADATSEPLGARFVVGLPV